MNALSVRPSPLGIILVSAGIVPALLPAFVTPALWPLWAVSVALLFILFLIEFVLGPRRRHLDIKFDLPETLSINQEYQARLALRLTYGRSRWCLIRLEHSRKLDLPEVLSSDVSLQPISVDFPVFARRRGRSSIDTIWVLLTGPMGLIHRTVSHRLDHEIEVLPNVQAVRELALAFNNSHEHRSGLKIERFVGAGSDFHAMRQYQPGLDLQSIDWKASARHRSLLCREYRAERNHHIVIAIDTGRLMTEEIGRLPRLDHAIHAGLLLSFMSLRAGDRVSLFSFAANAGQLSPPCSGVRSFPALLEMTSNLEYSTEETNFTLALTHLTATLKRRSLIVVLTDFVDTVSAELLMENVLRLSRTHLVVFAALKNPLFEEAMASEPRHPSDVDRAVIADMLATDRDLVIRKLQREGVFCVDAAPHELGSGLVHRYVEIKRRELI